MFLDRIQNKTIIWIVCQDRIISDFAGMSRTCAILVCLISAFFLVPLQGDCAEVFEYGPETEAVCPVSNCGVTVSENTDSNVLRKYEPKVRRSMPQFQKKTCVLIPMPPARILFCILRE